MDIFSLGMKADTRDLNRGKRDVDNFAKAGESAEKKVVAANKNMGQSFSGMAGFVRTASAALAAFGAAEFVRQVSDAAQAIQSIERTFTAATGSIEAGAMELQFVRNEADRLGLSLETTAKSYAQLAAAAKGTALEGQAARDIFSAVSEASTALGLSADQSEGALRALQQMISKGTVQAEELRGQLGERIPGAFQLAARAMGVTTAELGKMLENGEVLAEDLLPSLAAELSNTFGGQAEEGATQLTAEINRLKTAVFELKVAIGESGLTAAITTATRGLTYLIDEIRLWNNNQSRSGIELAKIIDQTDQWVDEIKNGTGELKQANFNIIEYSKSAQEAGFNIIDFAKANNEAFREISGVERSLRAQIVALRDGDEAVAKFDQSRRDSIQLSRLLKDATKQEAVAIRVLWGEYLQARDAYDQSTEAAKRFADASREQAAAQNALRNLRGQLDPLEAERQRYIDQLVVIENANIRAGEAEALREEAYRQHQERMTEIALENEEARSRSQALFAETQEQSLETVGNIFGNMAEIAKQGGEDMFDAWKATATAQAIVSTALAVSKALAAAPPPLNFALAGTVGALGALQVASIQNAQYQGARAMGGQVQEGNNYLVGERGPEVITMGGSGFVTPNHKLGGDSQQNVTVNVNNAPAGTRTEKRTDANGNMVVDVLIADMASGGQFSRSMQKTFGLKRQGR